MRPETRWTKHGKKPRNANKRKNTPIPFLALSMFHFNAPPRSKADYARLRATVADRLIAISQPKVRQRL